MIRKRVPELLAIAAAAACIFGFLTAVPPTMAPTASADPLGMDMTLPARKPTVAR